MTDNKSQSEKLEELLVSAAKIIAPDGGKELKDKMNEIIGRRGLPLTKQTYKAMGEGMDFAMQMHKDIKDENEFKQMLMLSIAFVKLFEKEALN